MTQRLDRICNLALFIVQHGKHGEIDANAMRDITHEISKYKTTNKKPPYFLNTLSTNNNLKLSEGIDSYLNDETAILKLHEIFNLAKKMQLNASLLQCFEVGIDLTKTAEKQEIINNVQESLKSYLLKDKYNCQCVEVVLKNKYCEFCQVFTLLDFLEIEVSENRLATLQKLLEKCCGTQTVDSNDNLDRVERVFLKEKNKIKTALNNKDLVKASKLFASCLRHPLQNLFEKYPNGINNEITKNIADFYITNICDIKLPEKK